MDSSQSDNGSVEQLQKMQLLSKMVGRVARLGGWTFDQKQQRLFWSDETSTIHDRPPGFQPDLDTAINYFLPKYREMIRNVVSGCLEDGIAFEFEAELVTAKNRIIWVHVVGESIRNSDGEVSGFQGAVQDITMQRANEIERNFLATELSSTLESMSDAFFTMDSNWNITYVNREMERTLNHTRAEMLNRRMWDVFPGTENSMFHACYQQAIDTGTVAVIEAYYEPMKKWFEVRSHPTRSGVAVYFQDTTALRDVKERLREQAELLDKAQDAIWLVSLEGLVEIWNPSAERIYGWRADQVMHRGARELLFNNPNVFDRCKLAVLEHGEWVGEIEHKTPDGKHLLLVSRWTLVRDEAGQPRSILAINTDITHQKQLEQQYLRAQRLESIGTLAGGIAHDLNNVLAPIMMSIELLKGSLTDPDDQAVLKTIAVSARRGADMIKQVLSFARGVEGTRHHVRITDVLRDHDQMLSEISPKNISIVSRAASNLWQVKADPTQLQQVLMNLCVNAQDAMPSGGSITISADNLILDAHYAAMNIEARVGSYVKIEVEDNGTGIPMDIQDRVFDPFFTTKPVGKGTGLGLATSMAIVKSHGGFVRLNSEVGKGTRIRVYLPADPSALSVNTADAQPMLPRGNGELILVVDDEAAIRQVTSKTLEAHGYRVAVASNGAEAVDLYSNNMHDIALVVTDMMMPIMDGPATVVALKKINPFVKLIGVSGVSQNGTSDWPQGLESHSFLPKPYTAEVLLLMIEAVLKRN